jgi:ADP-ribose pyrophosphatase YjhB (NUDIX family)
LIYYLLIITQNWVIPLGIQVGYEEQLDGCAIMRENLRITSWSFMSFKHRIAVWLKTIPPLRWGLAIAVRLFAPRNYVGAVAAIFNDAGQVLMVEHTFRPDYPWGLPGGWVEAGEDPQKAIERELQEELGLTVVVKKLLLCQPQGNKKESTTPLGLGLAYYGRVNKNTQPDVAPNSPSAAYEVLSVAWVDPATIEWKLVSLQQQAMLLGYEEYKREEKAQDTA